MATFSCQNASAVRFNYLTEVKWKKIIFMDNVPLFENLLEIACTCSVDMISYYLLSFVYILTFAESPAFICSGEKCVSLVGFFVIL